MGKNQFESINQVLAQYTEEYIVECVNKAARAASPKVPECQECKDTGMIMLGEEDGIHEVVACIRCEMETDARVSLSLKIPQSCACSREITTGWTSDNGIPLCNVCGMVDVSAAFEMAKDPPKVPQGVEEWMNRTPNLVRGERFYAESDIRAYLSGMALVPVDEITPEMWSAGRNEFCRIYDKVKYAMHSEIESAEIDAAPQSMMTAMLSATKGQQCQS